MITISLCMIVKNEEDTLAKCLNSVADIVEEIVIVDTGSTDHTKEIALQFTDKIYDFEWIDDFSAARNFSYEQATMDYIMWLDADDIILSEDAIKFKKLKETMTEDIDAVMMRYNTGFDSQGRVAFSYFRERLSRRSSNYKWCEPVHEFLDAGWKRLSTDICITHKKPQERFGERSNRNILIYENILSSGKELSPRGMYYYARELKDHGRYSDAIKWFGIFLDSGKGWIEDNIASCGAMAECCLAEKKPQQAFISMLRSFEYDTPRADICCQIGYFFKDQNKYNLAAYWFEFVLKLEKRENAWGFRKEDCLGYIPCIELAVCYDKMKQYKKAAEFNELAAQYKPDSSAVLFNRKYFEDRLKDCNN